MNSQRLNLVFLILTAAYAITTLTVSSIIVASLQAELDTASGRIARIDRDLEADRLLIENARTSTRDAQFLLSHLQTIGILGLQASNTADSVGQVKAAMASHWKLVGSSFAASLGTMCEAVQGRLDAGRHAEIQQLIHAAAKGDVRMEPCQAAMLELQRLFSERMAIAVEDRDTHRGQKEQLQRRIDGVRGFTVVLQFAMILALFAKDWWKERQKASAAIRG